MRMTLQTWANNGWLKPHQTSKQEITQLLEIVNRDLKDSKQHKLSADWRFGIAYNAALKLCTILMYIEGFKPEKALAHYLTLRALPLILGSVKDDDADYLDSCRAKRNIVEYDYIGGVTETDANELIAFTKEFKNEVLEWIKVKYPQYL
jgi:hypothetical protein